MVVNLSWTNTVTGATAVEVWRSTGAGFALYATLTPVATSYTDTAPVAGINNLYELRAVNATLGVQSGFTASVSISVPAMSGVLSNLTATLGS